MVGHQQQHKEGVKQKPPQKQPTKGIGQTPRKKRIGQQQQRHHTSQALQGPQGSQRSQGSLFEQLKDGRLGREVNVIQEMIYFFNQPKIRNYLVDYYLKRLYPGSSCQHAGTFFLQKEGDDVLSLQLDPYYHQGTFRRMNKTAMSFLEALREMEWFFQAPRKKSLYTLAILYESNAIHFVSFLYDKEARRLVCFDPGYNLYQNGSRVLIPTCAETFLRLGWIRTINDVISIGVCPRLEHGRRYGVQYDGGDPNTHALVADAFCQSWSLFFVLQCIMFDGDYNFVKVWCAMSPEERFQCITERFFFQHILQHPFVLNEFRKNFSGDHVRAIESLYAHTLHTHFRVDDQ